MTLLKQSRPHTYASLTRACATLALTITFIAVDVNAEPYDSFNGEFRIDIPDNWVRMDYRTVDFFLRQSSGDEDLLDYEAVFSPDRRGLFYDREYLMLTVDTSGQLSRRQIDSVLSDMSEAFDIPLERKPITDFATEIPAGEFIYDDERQLAAVATNVYDAGKVYKINLLAVKFYKKGTANFYFFAPDTSYSNLADTFQAIVSSFVSGKLESRTTKPVPVADIKPMSKDKKWPPYVIAAAAVILLVIAIRIVKTKSRAREA